MNNYNLVTIKEDHHLNVLGAEIFSSMYLKVDQTDEVSFTLEMFNTVIFNVIMKINFKYLGRTVHVLLKKWYWGMSSLAFKK